MKKKNIYLLVLCLTAALTSACSKKKSEISIQNNKKIQQRTNEKVEVQRLHFETKDFKTKYTGHEALSSFKIENPDSIPSGLLWAYTIANFKDSTGDIVHSKAFRNLFYKDIHNKDYYVLDFNHSFFIDIPTGIDINSIASVDFRPAESNDNTATSTTSIENPELAYKKKLSISGDGWSGKIQFLKLYGDTDSSEALDLVIHGDGFTEAEMPATTNQEVLLQSKFGGMLKASILELLNEEPLLSIKDKINIWIVMAPSVTSGTSVPSENKIAKTTYSSTFGTACVDRSLTVQDAERVLKFSEEVPYDIPIVLVNSRKHGGTGGAIAVFSNAQGLKNTMAHELAHTITNFADEYYYLSETKGVSADDKAVSACKDNRMDTRAFRKRDYFIGGNQMHDTDDSLAPNLSLHADLNTVRWSKHLTPESPIVYFDYLDSKALFSTDTTGPFTEILIPQNSAISSIEGTFKVQSSENRQNLIFLIGGFYPELNNTVSKNMKTIQVNNKTYHPISNTEQISNSDFKLENQFEIQNLPGSSLSFIVIKDQSIVEEALETGVVKVSFNFYNSQTRNLNPLLYDAQTVTMPHVLFDENRLGIFQGGNPSLEKVFRSSYRSVMMSSGSGFNPVLIDEFVKYIQPYFTK